jgi:hypothetical protein
MRFSEATDQRVLPPARSPRKQRHARANSRLSNIDAVLQTVESPLPEIYLEKGIYTASMSS